MQPQPIAAGPAVYSYTRFSTPEQAKGDSARRQNEAAKRWAQARGLTLDERLSVKDLGVSAFRGTNVQTDRGLGGFLQACREQIIAPGSYLLVESLDRISRMPPRRAQRLVDDIVDAGVTIVTLSDSQEYDGARLDEDPTALLISLMVSWRAHEESKTKGRRVAHAWGEKRRALASGDRKVYTRLGPKWLRMNGGAWEIDPQHGETVRRVYRETIAGAGEASIAAGLNRDAVPVMSRGKMWHRSTVAKLLRNPAVIGHLTPGRMDDVGGKRRRVTEAPVAGVYPAVVSEADWLAVRALKDGSIAAARGRHAHNRGLANMLAGLARCPECGAAMTRVSKGSAAKPGRPKLVCTRVRVGAAPHPYRTVDLAAVHDALAAGWAGIMSDIPAGDRSPALDAERDALAGEIAVTEDKLVALADQLEQSPSLTLSRHLRGTEAHLASLWQELDRVEEARAGADLGAMRTRLNALWSAFEAGDVGAINAALRAVFNAAVVDYLSGEVRLEWRQGGTASVRYAWPE